jgi:hypothetical protein
MVLRQARHIRSLAFALLQRSGIRRSSGLSSGNLVVIQRRRSFDDSGRIHWHSRQYSSAQPIAHVTARLTSTQCGHWRNYLLRGILFRSRRQMRFGIVAELQHTETLSPSILRLHGRREWAIRVIRCGRGTCPGDWHHVLAHRPWRMRRCK